MPSNHPKDYLKCETKVRKKKKTIPNDPGVSNAIVRRFSNGESSESISEDTGWTVESIKTEVQKMFRSMKNILETEALVASQKGDMIGTQVKTVAKMQLYRNQQKIDEDINEKFIEKLSLKNDTILTKEEMMFCYLLVHEGDEKSALENSGLAEGLATGVPGYKRAMKLRILMLKGKRNLIKYINDLQINYAKDLNIGKESIQTEILKQLRQLTEQNDRRNAPTIAKLTEQLGRTVGAFTDKISIEEVSFDDAMDRMLEMRKATVKQVGQGDGPDAGDPDKDRPEPTTFVYDPEKIG